MIFLMRHGEDDDSRLGGWSDASLCENGIEQVKKSCERLKDSKYNIEYIFSSDLQRAKETADIVSEYLAIPVTHLKEFRETNNGDLAGISKENTKAGLCSSTFIAMLETIFIAKEVLKEIKIKPEVVDPDDVEMLQDLILTCVNEALKKVDSAQAASLGQFNIPGFM